MLAQYIGMVRVQLAIALAAWTVFDRPIMNFCHQTGVLLELLPSSAAVAPPTSVPNDTGKDKVGTNVGAVAHSGVEVVSVPAVPFDASILYSIRSISCWKLVLSSSCQDDLLGLQYLNFPPRLPLITDLTESKLLPWLFHVYLIFNKRVHPLSIFLG